MEGEAAMLLAHMLYVGPGAQCPGWAPARIGLCGVSNWCEACTRAPVSPAVWFPWFCVWPASEPHGRTAPRCCSKERAAAFVSDLSAGAG